MLGSYHSPIWATLTIALLSIASCKTTEHLTTENVEGNYLVLSIGDAFYGKEIYLLTDSNIAFQETKASDGRKRVRNRKTAPVSYQLSKNEASRIWALIEQYKIEEWKDEYLPEHFGYIVEGGTHWSVEIRKNGLDRKIRGHHVFPALNPIGNPTQNHGHNAYHKVLRILKTALSAAQEEAVQNSSDSPK